MALTDTRPASGDGYWSSDRGFGGPNLSGRRSSGPHISAKGGKPRKTTMKLLTQSDLVTPPSGVSPGQAYTVVCRETGQRKTGVGFTAPTFDHKAGTYHYDVPELQQFDIGSASVPINRYSGQ